MEAITVESIFNFFNQGWVGSVIGLAGMLIGSILSILFFLKSKRTARPTVQFSRMTILSPRADEVFNDVQILYKGNEINKLSKTNIILWNDGTETLHGSSVVEDSPIRVSFEEGNTILRCQVVKETRPVNRSRLELVEGKRNAINIKFDFFDPCDGINVEILHDSKSDPIITGTIRGIPSGIKVINGISPRPIYVNFLEELISGRSMLPFVVTATVGISLFAFGFLFKLNVLDDKIINNKLRDSTIIMAMGLLYALLPVTYLWLFRKRYPKELNE